MPLVQKKVYFLTNVQSINIYNNDEDRDEILVNFLTTEVTTDSVKTRGYSFSGILYYYTNAAIVGGYATGYFQFISFSHSGLSMVRTISPAVYYNQSLTIKGLPTLPVKVWQIS